MIRPATAARNSWAGAQKGMNRTNRGVMLMRLIIADMSSAVSQKVLGQVLAAAGSSLSPADFLSILGDAVDSTDTLTGPERTFLLVHAGVAPDVFDQRRVAQARQRIAVEAAKADSDATRGGYTTSEAARLLGTAPANVRRTAARGDLYTSGLRHNREHVFPAWQFPGGRPLPHLRKVISALPADMHPLDMATFMTAPQETLGNRSVAEWLADGGTTDPAVRLADGLSRL